MATPETIPAIDTKTWCEDGTPTTDIDADGGSVGTGWAASVDPPPRQRWNWILFQLHRAVRYLLHRGIPDYRSTETYAVGDRIQHTDGKTYKCIQANIPASPHAPTDTAYWTEWGGVTASDVSTAISAAVSVASVASSVSIDSDHGIAKGACVLTTIGSQKRLLVNFSNIPYNVGPLTMGLSGSAAFTVTHSFIFGKSALIGDYVTPTVRPSGNANEFSILYGGVTPGSFAELSIELIGS